MRRERETFRRCGARGETFRRCRGPVEGVWALLLAPLCPAMLLRKGRCGAMLRARGEGKRWGRREAVGGSMLSFGGGDDKLVRIDGVVTLFWCGAILSDFF